MYMYIYIMSKNIMVSDSVYLKLKKIKEMRNESFSEVILERIEPSKKTGEGLKECLGILKGDKEYGNEWRETLKKGWKRWNKRYA